MFVLDTNILSAMISTGPSNSPAIYFLSATYSHTPTGASGSISIMMSVSLSGRASPRAHEPNSAACATPRERSAASFSRRRATTLRWPMSHLRVLRPSARICVKPLLASPRATPGPEDARTPGARQKSRHQFGAAPSSHAQRSKTAVRCHESVTSAASPRGSRGVRPTRPDAVYAVARRDAGEGSAFAPPPPERCAGRPAVPGWR